MTCHWNRSPICDSMTTVFRRSVISGSRAHRDRRTHIHRVNPRLHLEVAEVDRRRHLIFRSPRSKQPRRILASYRADFSFIPRITCDPQGHLRTDMKSVSLAYVDPLRWRPSRGRRRSALIRLLERLNTCHDRISNGEHQIKDLLNLGDRRVRHI